MRRFIGLRWTPARSDLGARARSYAAAAARAHGLSQLIAWRGLLVLADAQAQTDGDPFLALPHDTGFVFGPIFARGEEEEEAQGAEAALSYARAHAFAQSGGEGFFAAFWGSYVALLVDRAHDGVHLLRDPMGGRACFLTRLGEIRCFFSDPALLACMSAPTLRFERVAAFLAYPHLASGATAIAGLEELAPGALLSMHRDGETRAQLWRPPAPKALAGFAEAAKGVAKAAGESVGAWTRSKPQILHRLSGGLDSTIVLALLAEAPPKSLLCVNECSSAGPEGDERLMARAAAAHFGVPLEEIIIDPRGVDFARCFEAPLMAAPSMSILSYASNAYREALGARAEAWLTSGQGGDQVFCRTRSSLFAADAARAHPIAWARVAYDLARLSGQSFWRVASDGLRYGLLQRTPDFTARLAGPRGFVPEAAAQAAIAQQMRHPWLEGWRTMAPGRVERILALLDALHYHAPSSFSRDFMPAPVLLSQPIVEAAMEIPSYLMLAGGRDRAIYRAAFKPLLPAWAARRTSKGRTTRHFGEAVQNNRAVLREALLGGELIRTGLVDKNALEAAANACDVVSLDQMNALLTAFAAEVWLRSCMKLETKGAAAPRAQAGEERRPGP